MEVKVMESKAKIIVAAVLGVAALIAFMTLNPLVIVHPGQRRSNCIMGRCCWSAILSRVPRA